MLFLKIFSDKDKELELLDDKYTSPIADKFHWVKEIIAPYGLSIRVGLLVPSYNSSKVFEQITTYFLLGAIATMQAEEHSISLS